MNGDIDILFEEVSKGNEEEESDDVAINRENKLADAHIKSGSRNDMEASVAKLKGQHGRMQLETLRNRAPHSL